MKLALVMSKREIASLRAVASHLSQEIESLGDPSEAVEQRAKANRLAKGQNTLYQLIALAEKGSQ